LIPAASAGSETMIETSTVPLNSGVEVVWNTGDITSGAYESITVKDFSSEKALLFTVSL